MSQQHYLGQYRFMSNHWTSFSSNHPHYDCFSVANLFSYVQVLRLVFIGERPISFSWFLTTITNTDSCFFPFIFLCIFYFQDILLSAFHLFSVYNLSILLSQLTGNDQHLLHIPWWISFTMNFYNCFNWQLSFQSHISFQLVKSDHSLRSASTLNSKLICIFRHLLTSVSEMQITRWFHNFFLSIWSGKTWN